MMDRMDKNYYGPGPIKMHDALNEIHKANMVTTEPGSIGAGERTKQGSMGAGEQGRRTIKGLFFPSKTCFRLQD